MSQPPSSGPPDPDRPASSWEQPTAGPEPSPSHETDPNQPLEHGAAPGSQPQWGQQQHHLYGPPQRPSTNVLAVLSLVFAFVFAPAGIVLGHLARRQLRTSGESGGQLATVGLVLSYIFTVLGLLTCCGMVFAASAPIPGNPNSY